MKVLVIIPAFNEEKSLTTLISNIKLNLPKCDILIVNDCSTDNTKHIRFEYKVIRIDLPINLGIGGAVQTGYKYAYENDYDIAIQVDGDGQHDCYYLKDLIDQIKNGTDLCIGSRYINKIGFQSTTLRRIGIRYFSKLIKLVCGQLITDPTSGFRACNKSIIELFATNYPQDFPEPETLVRVKKKGFKINEIPVVMNHRVFGKSSIDLKKSIYYMIKVSLAVCLIPGE
jgi:glycosyltransferase involved in cell wall biosynthesis